MERGVITSDDVPRHRRRFLGQIVWIPIVVVDTFVGIAVSVSVAIVTV
jgi:hypothetical protein